MVKMMLIRHVESSTIWNLEWVSKLHMTKTTTHTISNTQIKNTLKWGPSGVPISFWVVSQSFPKFQNTSKWCVCIIVYVYTYLCTHTYTYTYIYIHTYLIVCIYIYIIYILGTLFWSMLHACMHTYICTYVPMYVWTVCTYILHGWMDGRMDGWIDR